MSRFLIPLVCCACAVPGLFAWSVGGRTHVVPASVELVDYKSIGGTHFLHAPVSLCWLVDNYTAGAGVYEVDAITGVREVSANGRRITPATFVSLKLVEAWTEEAPKFVTVRVSGGPTGVFVKGDEVVRSWSVELSIGERVGALLHLPSDVSRGFEVLDDIGIFRPGRDGLFRGLQHFREGISSPELSELLRQLAVRISDDVCNELMPSDDIGDSEREQSSLDVVVGVVQTQLEE